MSPCPVASSHVHSSPPHWLGSSPFPAAGGRARCWRSTGRRCGRRPDRTARRVPPEGIAIDPRGTAYLGSLADGDIYAADLRTGEGEVISEGPGSPSVGLKIDQSRSALRLGRDVRIRARHRHRDRRRPRDYQLTTGPAFINDVVLTRDGAWFTNSSAAELYLLPVSPSGGLPDASEILTLPLTGDWVQVARVQRQRHRRDARPQGAPRDPVGDGDALPSRSGNWRGDRGRPRRVRAAERRRAAGDRYARSMSCRTSRTPWPSSAWMRAARAARSSTN